MTDSAMRNYCAEPRGFITCCTEADLLCFANGPDELIVEGVYGDEGAGDLLKSDDLSVRWIAQAVALAAKRDRKFIASVWTSQEEERAERLAEHKYEHAPRLSRVRGMGAGR